MTEPNQIINYEKTTIFEQCLKKDNYYSILRIAKKINFLTEKFKF